MARKTKEESEKTYHSLLDAATTLFARQGVAKTTLNEIAKSAGMTRGAVYWHFPNKDAVIMALWKRDAGSVHDEVTATFTHLKPDSALKDFETLVKDMLKKATDDLKLTQALKIVTSSIEFTEEASGLQLFLMQRKNELYDAMKKAVALLQEYQAITTKHSTDLLAASLWSYIIGMVDTHLEMSSEKIDIKNQADELIQLWIDSVTPNTAHLTQRC